MRALGAQWASLFSMDVLSRVSELPSELHRKIVRDALRLRRLDFVAGVEARGDFLLVLRRQGGVVRAVRSTGRWQLKLAVKDGRKAWGQDALVPTFGSSPVPWQARSELFGGLSPVTCASAPWSVRRLLLEGSERGVASYLFVMRRCGRTSSFSLDSYDERGEVGYDPTQLLRAIVRGLSDSGLYSDQCHRQLPGS